MQCKTDEVTGRLGGCSFLLSFVFTMTFRIHAPQLHPALVESLRCCCVNIFARSPVISINNSWKFPKKSLDTEGTFPFSKHPVFVISLKEHHSASEQVYHEYLRPDILN
jgi:hypothetical protein